MRLAPIYNLNLASPKFRSVISNRNLANKSWKTDPRQQYFEKTTPIKHNQAKTTKVITSYVETHNLNSLNRISFNLMPERQFAFVYFASRAKASRVLLNLPSFEISPGYSPKSQFFINSIIEVLSAETGSFRWVISASSRVGWEHSQRKARWRLAYPRNDLCQEIVWESSDGV